MTEQRSDEDIRKAVRQAYGTIAAEALEQGSQKCATSSCCAPRQATNCCASNEPASCCGTAAPDLVDTWQATRFYSMADVSALPESVTGVALGCGDPTAIADLAPGEVVLDLGAGGGIDCFLAARQVGPEGKVIGLDMTPSMIQLARRNAKEMGVTNVDFRYGEIEDIPLPDESVDVIISNCVINLSPDKDAVFREAFRVLRPGGRLSVSDIVIDGELPDEMREMLDVWAACVGGAVQESEYMEMIRAAGFAEVDVLSRQSAAMVASPGATDGCCDSGGDEADAGDALSGTGVSLGDVAQQVVSIKVRARKGT